MEFEAPFGVEGLVEEHGEHGGYGRHYAGEEEGEDNLWEYGVLVGGMGGKGRERRGTYTEASDVWFCAVGAGAVVVCCAVEGDPWRGHALLKVIVEGMRI